MNITSEDITIIDIFSQEQCEYIINKLDNNLELMERGGITKYYRKVFKSNDISTYLTSKIVLPEYINNFKVKGFNDHIRFSKYIPGQEFDIHRDSIYTNKKNYRSFLTLNIFLNDNFKGGETVFLTPKKITVKPKLGCGVLFYGQNYHKGNIVTEGFKYLLRTDVMIDYKLTF